MIIVISEGTVNGPTLWSVDTADPIVIGTTALTIVITNNALLGVTPYIDTLLDDADFVEAIGTLGLQPHYALGSVAGTNTITATAATTLTAHVAGDLLTFVPANDNTGAVTLNVDTIGAGAVQLNGAALVGAELNADVPVTVRVKSATPVFEVVASGAGLGNINGPLNVTGVITSTTGHTYAVGDMISSFGSSRTGFLLVAGQTVGSASSGATDASADYAAVFAFIWDNVADAEAAVSTGRGASAAADFAADKTITFPDGRGRVLLGKDNMGGSSANVVTDTEADTIGDTAGDEEHSQIIAELAAHTHTAFHQASPSYGQPAGGVFFTAGITGSTGSGTAMNIMNPYMTTNLFIRY
jgi:hypothetical protein